MPCVDAACHVLMQHSTAQHSTAQHSTAQHSTAQHSTAVWHHVYQDICLLYAVTVSVIAAAAQELQHCLCSEKQNHCCLRHSRSSTHIALITTHASDASADIVTIGLVPGLQVVQAILQMNRHYSMHQHRRTRRRQVTFFAFKVQDLGNPKPYCCMLQAQSGPY